MVVAERRITDVENLNMPDLDEVVTVIRVNGGLFLKPRQAPEVTPRLSPLSRREIEILDYVAGGHSNKQISNRCDISEHTVKNHLTTIMQKLNAKDRTHAVVTALRAGWLSI